MSRRRRYTSSGQTHLLVFFTQGPPHDTGGNVEAAASELTRKARGHFGSVTAFSPQLLIEKGAMHESYLDDLTETVHNHELFSADTYWNPSWARVGLQRWKPALIHHMLTREEVEDGDIVFYHDSNLEKYPQYAYGISQWASWIQRRMRRLDVLAFDDNRVPLFSDTKPELWSQFMSENEARTRHHIWSGALAVRKNPQGIDFVERWRDLCNQTENLIPATRASSWPDFAQHSPDQATLSCLWYSDSSLDRTIQKDCAFLHNSRQIPPPALPERLARRVARWARQTIRRGKRTLSWSDDNC